MDHAALEALITPVLARHGLELDQLDLVPAGRRTVLRVTVDGDGPRGRGPLLDDIAVASNDVSAALDASPALGDRAYTLEVSSRGVTKPLTDEKHFRRNTGRLVALTTADGQSLKGRIMAVIDGAVTLQVTPEPTKQNRHPKPQTHEVPVDQIRKGVVQIEMNRPWDAELDDLGSPDEDEPDDDLDEELGEDDDLDEDERDDEAHDHEEEN